MTAPPFLHRVSVPSGHIPSSKSLFKPLPTGPSGERTRACPSTESNTRKGAGRQLKSLSCKVSGWWAQRADLKSAERGTGGSGVQNSSCTTNRDLRWQRSVTAALRRIGKPKPTPIARKIPNSARRKEGRLLRNQRKAFSGEVAWRFSLHASPREIHK